MTRPLLAGEILGGDISHGADEPADAALGDEANALRPGGSLCGRDVFGRSSYLDGRRLARAGIEGGLRDEVRVEVEPRRSACDESRSLVQEDKLSQLIPESHQRWP